MKLESVTLFRGVAKSDLEKLEKVTQAREFKKGDMLFMEGDPPDNLLFILEGEVKVFKEYVSGKSAVMGLFDKGDIVAAVPVIDGMPYPASCQAVTHGVAGIIKRKEAFEIISKNPALAFAFMKDLSEKLRQITGALGSMAVKSVIMRLSRFLLTLSEKMGTQEKDGVKIELLLTRKDIAEVIGSSFEVVVRALGRLQNENVIKIEGKIITLLNKERMEKIAEGG